MDYVIRPLTDADQPILWELLFLALHDPANEAAPQRDIINRPEFSRYVEDWGREGDRGFVAHDVATQDLLGGVWFRPPSGPATPQLAFAVAPGHRRRGIGAALLTQWVRANPEQSEVSLRVSASHPAARLYERFGFKVAHEADGSVTMRRDA